MKPKTTITNIEVTSIENSSKFSTPASSTATIIITSTTTTLTSSQSTETTTTTSLSPKTSTSDFDMEFDFAESSTKSQSTTATIAKNKHRKKTKVPKKNKTKSSTSTTSTTTTTTKPITTLEDIIKSSKMELILNNNTTKSLLSNMNQMQNTNNASITPRYSILTLTVLLSCIYGFALIFGVVWIVWLYIRRKTMFSMKNSQLDFNRDFYPSTSVN
jgi:hypothetical protein